MRSFTAYGGTATPNTRQDWATKTWSQIGSDRPVTQIDAGASTARDTQRGTATQFMDKRGQTQSPTIMMWNVKDCHVGYDTAMAK